MITNLAKSNHIPITVLRNYFLLTLFCFLTVFNTHAQKKDEIKPKRWGIQFGYGTQQTAPFHNPDYFFEQGAIIGQVELKKLAYKKIQLSLLAEGGYFKSTHQLLNKWFTTTDYFKDFPADFQQRMLKRKNIHQVAFHVAVEASYQIHSQVNLFASAAIGPLWGFQQTERLAKGLAFSDNFALGISFKLSKNTWLSNAVIIRHESNADLKFPNSGHNTIGIRTGVVFNLTAPQRALTLRSTPRRP